jgi:polar amino acid transport system substrate-binding protein
MGSKPSITRRQAMAAAAFGGLAALGLAGCSGGSGSGDAGSGSTGSDATSATATPGKLVVAMELAYPPFETKDDDGTPDGVSVQFMKDFGAAKGYDVEISDTSWDGLIPSLQTGKADCVMSSMTITDERKESVDFSEPYANAHAGAARQQRTPDIQSPSTTSTRPASTIAVKTGSTGDTYATSHLDELHRSRGWPTRAPAPRRSPRARPTASSTTSSRSTATRRPTPTPRRPSTSPSRTPSSGASP